MSFQDSKIAVLIPAYNPDEKLLTLLDSLRRVFPKIMVVDDGSETGKDIFTRLPEGVELVRHAVNFGKGRALKTGINALLVAFPECSGIITADCDGQHTPADIMHIAEIMLASPEALVLGVRNFTGKNIPLRSRFGNVMTCFIFCIFTGLYVRDTQTGLRGIPACFLADCLRMPGERYEYEMNMLAAGANMKPRPVQVPIATVYLDENKSSHFNPIEDSFRIVRVLFHFFIGSVLAFLLDTIVFMAIASFGHGIGICTAVSRAVSGTFNFLYNKKLIFRPNGGMFAFFFISYWVLVLILGTAAYFGITFMNRYSGFPLLVNKVLVESVLFLASFFLQKHVVFKSRRK